MLKPNLYLSPMKNFTLWTALILASITLQAQQTSFEDSEGYPAGQIINGINGWHENSNHFLISNEKSSEGENSLKMTYDSNEPLIFADWVFPEILPAEDNLEISMDIYVPGDMTTFYWKIMSNDEYAAYIIVQESYVFPAKVTVVNPVPMAMAPINVGEFNEIKLVFNYTNETITYYANGEEIYQSELWGSREAIDKYSLEAFLWQDTYIDNLKTNSSLGTVSIKETPLLHYIQNNTLILESSVEMEEVEIFNILGKQIHSQKIKELKTSIEISFLKSGVYIVRLKINNKWQSFKFVK